MQITIPTLPENLTVPRGDKKRFYDLHDRSCTGDCPCAFANGTICDSKLHILLPCRYFDKSETGRVSGSARMSGQLILQSLPAKEENKTLSACIK